MINYKFYSISQTIEKILKPRVIKWYEQLYLTKCFHVRASDYKTKILIFNYVSREFM